MLIVACILATAFIGFSIPASADYYPIYVSERYYEEVVELTNTGTNLIELSFEVDFEGYYIIQVFGCPDPNNSNGVPANGQITQIMVYRGRVCLAETIRGIYSGYGRGQMASCYLQSETIHTLFVEISGTVEELRLSFTYTEDMEYDAPPNYYDEIYTDGPDFFEFTFNASNGEYAQVARVLCGTNNSGCYEITLGGGGFEQAYILDPRYSSFRYGIRIFEGDTAVMDLEANVPYYIVVFIGDGNAPINLVDMVIATLEFEQIG